MGWLNTLVEGVKQTISQFPDSRSGEGWSKYSMKDFGMSAFSMFFMQSESFLGFQRNLESERRTSNCQTLFGIEAIPSDNQIRNMLDEVSPEHLQPCFDQQIEILTRSEGFQHFQVLGEQTLVVLDGSEYFSSTNISCACCQTRQRANGRQEHYHSMLAASIVRPGDNRVLSLMPEFITPQDGHDKQDCEQAAAKRWLNQHHDRIAALKPIYMGDDLFAHQPIVAAILAKNADFLMVCKPSSHKTLYDFIDRAPMPEHQTTQRRGKKIETRRYRWMNEVPLRDGEDALLVNWLSIEIRNGDGTITYQNAFVTNLPISKHNVIELSECGRARWKIENGSFNVLKNNGYNLTHSFGHGKKYLAMLFVSLNLLAFNCHTLCELLDERWRQAMAKQGARRRFFQHLSAVTTYLIFPSWELLLKTLIDSKPPPEVMLASAP